MTSTPSVIHFTCQSCGILLTVPVELAGVTGPCPRCGVAITSPRVEQPAPLSYHPAPGVSAQLSHSNAPYPHGGMPSAGGHAQLQLHQPGVPAYATPPVEHPAFSGLQAPSPLGAGLTGASWPPAGAGTGTHRVMEGLLQSHGRPAQPSALEASAAVRPVAATGPSSIPPYQPRGSGHGRRRSSSSSSRDRNRHGAMWAALFMAALAITGTCWFFRDQLKTAWSTYALKLEKDTAPAQSSSSAAAASAQPAVTPPQAPPSTFDPVATVPRATMVAPPPAPAPVPPPTPPVTIMPAKPAEPLVTPPPGGLVEVPGTSQPGPPLNIVVDASPEAQPALEALKKFFAAPTWQERLPYVQTPDSMKPIMQQYYAANPDGPLNVTHIQLIRSDKAPETGPPHCVFQVSGGGLKQPVPLMVENTEEGWKVDWLTFTEFKDQLLVKFLESYQQQSARFHVLIRRAHYFNDDVPAMDKKSCFQITPPMPGFSGDVFVTKGTPLAREMDQHLGWDVTQAAVVVELQWRKEGRYQWVELTQLVQYNWRNGEPPAPKAVSVDAASSGVKN